MHTEYMYTDGLAECTAMAFAHATDCTQFTVQLTHMTLARRPNYHPATAADDLGMLISVLRVVAITFLYGLSVQQKWFTRNQLLRKAFLQFFLYSNFVMSGSLYL